MANPTDFVLFQTGFECVDALKPAVEEFNRRYKENDNLFNTYQALLRQITRDNICTKELTNALATCKNRLENCGYHSMGTSPMVAPQGVFYQEDIALFAAPSISDLKLENVPRFNWLAAVDQLSTVPSLAICSDIYNGIYPIPVIGAQQPFAGGVPITYWNGLLHTNFVRLSNRLEALKPEIAEASKEYTIALGIYNECCQVLSGAMKAGLCPLGKTCNDPNDPIMQQPTRAACIPTGSQNDGII
jgi:hypothetical protein